MGDDYVLVASPTLDRGRLPKTPSDLAGFPLLRADAEPWQAWCATAGVALVRPDRGVAYEDMGVMLQSAIDGHGILLARRSIARAEIERGTVVVLFGISTPSSSSYWLVRPEEPAPSPRAVAFRDWLFAEVAADEAAAPSRRGVRAKPRAVRRPR